MSTENFEARRYELSKNLAAQHHAPRNVVALENHRVTDLLDEQYIDPYAGETQLKSLGRSLLSSMGLHKPKPPILIHRTHLESSQAEEHERIKKELERSRELIKNTVVEGIDDVAIDVRLGVRTDDCLLPPFLQEQHKQAEEQEGNQIPFLKWMAEQATDEQLLNVWQWHDSYLDNLDNDPEFQERVSSVKESFKIGLDEVVEANVLHPQS